MEQLGAMHWADYVLICFYLSLMLAVGVYFSRYIKELKDYYRGGNRMPWWVAGLSAYMTTFSAFAFVGVASVAYTHGFTIAFMYWSCTVGFVLGARFLAARWRRSNVTTPPEYLEERFNLPVSQLLAWTYVPIRSIDNGMRLYSMSIFLGVATGLDLRVTIITAGIVVILYTMLGGVWAVAVTDVIQFIVLTVAILIVLPLSIVAVGGFSGFISGSPPGFFSPTNGPYDWWYIGGFAVFSILAYAGNWPVAQRYYSVPDDRDAKKAGYLASALSLTSPILWCIPPMAARQILPHLTNPEMAYVALCLKMLPIGMVGLVLAAMFAATASALDSEYNMLSGVLTSNVYIRFFRPEASDRHRLLVGRLTTVLVGTFTIIMAMFVPKLGGAFQTLVKNFGLSAPPTLIPFIWGMLYRRTPPLGVILTFVLGLSTGIVLNFVVGASWGIATLGNAAVCVAVMSLSGWLFPMKGEGKTRVDKFFERITSPLPKAEVRGKSEDGPSPFYITGVVCLATGISLVPLSLIPQSSLNSSLTLSAAAVLMGLGYLMWRSHRRSSRVNSLDGDAPVS
ncbi:sodium:solute symporter family protein [candidate division KSB1 bacterium]